MFVEPVFVLVKPPRRYVQSFFRSAFRGSTSHDVVGYVDLCGDLHEPTSCDLERERKGSRGIVFVDVSA